MRFDSCIFTLVDFLLCSCNREMVVVAELPLSHSKVSVGEPHYGLAMVEVFPVVSAYRRMAIQEFFFSCQLLLSWPFGYTLFLNVYILRCLLF